MKRNDVRPQSFTKQLCCDRCAREADIDDVDCEFHEFTSIEYKAGYGSVFGDGNKVEVDLCQHCLKELLGAWIRVTDPTEGFDIQKHGGEFPNRTSLFASLLTAHAPVVATRPLAELGLPAGATGVIVHVYSSGNRFEVEFFDSSKKSVGVLTLDEAWIALKDGKT
jgi:hypothetical protein